MSNEGMTEQQLLQAESDYADNKFSKHPAAAGLIAKAAREAATQTGDLKLINRFSKLAEHLERIAR